MLVRFLGSPEEQASRCRKPCEPPTVPASYKNADVLGANPYVSRVLQVHEGAALRPSVPAGKMYPGVSRAYYETVHAVLTQRQSAANAASNLQEQLVKLLKSSAADSQAASSTGMVARYTQISYATLL